MIQTVIPEIGTPQEIFNHEETCKISLPNGSCVIHDVSTIGLTANPFRTRHRGWLAITQEGKPLSFLRRGRRQATPCVRITRRFSSSKAAILALTQKPKVVNHHDEQ